jgi:hypothetical protein
MESNGYGTYLTSLIPITSSTTAVTSTSATATTAAFVTSSNNNTEDSESKELNQEAEATEEEKGKGNKMVISTVGLLGVGITVIDGEVIPVENTPPHPPPLPKPPPLIIGFDYRIHRWLHSSTSTDGEKEFISRPKVVDAGEVTLVENTPPHRPPPSIIDNNNGYEYSVTSINGEWTLLVRSAYQVDRMYRTIRPQSRTVPCRLAYRVNRLYRFGKYSVTSIDGEWTLLVDQRIK